MVWRKDRLFSKWQWEHLISKKNKTRSLVSLVAKINTKLIKELNVRLKSVKLLQENTGNALGYHDI
jgi:hypothetical protein